MVLEGAWSLKLKVFLFCLGYKPTFEEEIISEIEVKRYPSNQFEYKVSALAYTLPLYKFLMSKKITHFEDAFG